MYISITPKTSPAEQNTVELLLYSNHRSGSKNRISKTLRGIETLEGIYSITDANGHTWSVDLHADERYRRVGQSFIFQTDGEDPEYTEHNGQACNVLRMLTKEENDIMYSGLMWKVQFDDGVILDAWDHELLLPTKVRLDLDMNPAQIKPIQQEALESKISKATLRAETAEKTVLPPGIEK